MITPVQTLSTTRAVILPADLDHQLRIANGGRRRAIASRLDRFVTWLEAQGSPWYQPDLGGYRDHLLGAGLKPSTVAAHLSTIRSRYHDLLTDNAIRAMLRDQAAVELARRELSPTPAEIKAVVDELLLTLQNAVQPRHSRVTLIQRQDRAGDEFLRLTRAQANALIASPGTERLPAKRDTALIALALATGVRAAELAALQVGDHRATTEDGALALLIRAGKGAKQRLVPYGELAFAADLVQDWLTAARLVEGPIFRGFIGRGSRLRPEAITVEAIEHMLKKYPLKIGETYRHIKPHDLRRTYARLAFESGMDPIAIQLNLGHERLETTLTYIGKLDSEQRKPSGFLQRPESGPV